MLQQINSKIQLMELCTCWCYVRKSTTFIYFSLNVIDQVSRPYRAR